jgi:Tol biopolymer transport system component
VIPASRSNDGLRFTAALPRTATSFALLLALAACADATGPGRVADTEGQIYFVSTRAGEVNEFGLAQRDIYRMSADGSNVERLTTQGSAYKDLQLSPDGTRIAFYADLGACYDIWVVNLDGTGLTQLTGVAGYERCNEMPEWSPDGSKIAFISSRHPELGWDAYVVNADGSGVVNISNNPSTDVGTYNESVDGWAPDGRVVMSSTRDGTLRTYLVSPDGTGLEPLFGTGDYLYPQWSPDGTKVLAASDREGNRELYVLDADGSDAVNVTHDPGYDGTFARGGAAWSPDGSMIAFYSRRTGDAEIYVVRADGTGLVDVSDNPAEDDFAGWSPDGSQILFSSDRTGDLELFLVDADGGNLVNVTESPAAEDGPDAVWVPRR